MWGDNDPHFWDQGVQGGTEGRSNENDLCFYSRQSLFSIVQVTEFQLVIVNLVIVNLYSAFM